MKFLFGPWEEGIEKKIPTGRKVTKSECYLGGLQGIAIGGTKYISEI